ncbi:MAG TPA: replication-relaxation family protein [Chloroflexota bacterium]|nr:replication-relaxation family protein [Chloroflexota bacterium]
MSPDWRWWDAERNLAVLRSHPADRRNLLLLARLPLVPPRLIQRLEGTAGGASGYRSLARLAKAELVTGLRVPLRPGSAPRLLFVTDLGLAAVALDQGIDGRDLARRNRLRTADLLALLPGLPHLLAAYELLGLLATSHPGRPNLLAWERPWRRRGERRGANRSVSVSLPAYAALSWDDEWGAFLLVPDRGTFPLRLYRHTLRRLLIVRQILGDVLPLLVVATTGAERARAWRELLDDVARDGRADPLAARVATWETASVDLAGPWPDVGPGAPGPSARAASPPLHPSKSLPAGRRIPLQVGDDVTRPPATGGAARVSLAAAYLSPEDHRLLALIGHHPILPLCAMADVLGWTPAVTRHRCRYLVELGLARLVDAGEVGAKEATIGLAELTRDGLRLVASWQGLPLTVAVRENGLVGGGPIEPVGGRYQLLSHLAHTLGADAVFVALIASARRQGGALVEWRNAAACARGRVRPDGYGLYCHGQQGYGFFLEYDRGTMGERALLTKFSAYYDYRDSGRYRRDYVGFPTILVVAVDNAAEERLARAAQYAAIGRPLPIRALLTTEWRVSSDRESHAGLLGRIWREPHAAFHDRQSWPSDRTPSAESQTVGMAGPLPVVSPRQSPDIRHDGRWITGHTGGV